MVENRGEGDPKVSKMEEDHSAYHTPSSDTNKKLPSVGDDLNAFEDDGSGEYDFDDETEEVIARILQEQLEQMKSEIAWNKAGVEALRSEMGERGDDPKSEASTPSEAAAVGDQSMSEYQWSLFLYEWRRKFGEWGKRVLDVNQCENNDRLKAAHLLIEIYRRRRALASCKAHIVNLLKAAGQLKSIEPIADRVNDQVDSDKFL